MTSTKPDPSLRKFAPATNGYARSLTTNQFSVITDIKQIDPSVLTIFYSKIPAREIANRGKPFNPTDVADERLPSRRFVLAGSNSEMWFILYEIGGYARHHNLMVFEKNKNWHLVAAVSGFVEENSLRSLKQAINAVKFFDQPGYPQY